MNSYISDLDKKHEAELNNFQAHLNECSKELPHIPREIVFESYVLQQIANIKFILEKNMQDTLSNDPTIYMKSAAKLFDAGSMDPVK